MEMEIISFDLDGTLVRRDLVDRFWYEEVPKLYAENNGLEFDEAVESVKDKYDDVGPDDIRWFLPQYWFDRFGFEEDPKEVLEDIGHLVRMFEDAEEVLEVLSESNSLIVISNSSREFLETQLEGLKGRFFNTYSATSDFGKIKEDVEVYREVCEDLYVDPEEVVHIGDDRVSDYEVPKKLGIRSFFLDRERDSVGRRDVLNDLREIFNRLELF